MRKPLAAAVAAITFTGAVASVAAPAQARSYYDGGEYHRSHHDNGASTAIIAGIAGLAIGAAIASSSHKHHNHYGDGYYSGDRGGYDNGYGAYGSRDEGWASNSAYGRAYGYGSGYNVCESRQVAYDPYSGEQRVVRSQYAC